MTELTKALEDYREDLVVIVAGYTEPMEKFFESNPGLKPRFNKFIEFDDFDEHELFEILLSMCKKNEYEITEEAQDLLKEVLHDESNNKGNQFANGRYIRNLYDNCIMNQARRVSEIENPNKEDLIRITKEDVNEMENNL